MWPGGESTRFVPGPTGPPDGSGSLPSVSSGPFDGWSDPARVGRPYGDTVARDGRTWLVVGAHDAAVLFLDAATGEPILPKFQTGHIVKGSVTIDPDGYPLASDQLQPGHRLRPRPADRAVAAVGVRLLPLWGSIIPLPVLAWPDVALHGEGRA